MASAGSDTSNVIEIKTVQTPSIKTVFESLKDILIDANLLFSNEGIKIVETNPTKTLLVHMELNSSFEKLYCKKNKVVGVNLTNLYKPMKTMGSSDILVIRMKDTEDKADVITLDIQNSDKEKSLTCDIKLMDIDITKMKLDDLDYDSAITMPSEELQNICKALLSFDVTIVDINSTGKHLFFSGESDTGSYKYEYTTDGSKDINITSTSKINIVQGYFSLKYLTQFTKCTSLSTHVKLYLGNDKPITVEYEVGSMGVLKFVLAPKNPE